jgi:hypothetical protein
MREDWTERWWGTEMPPSEKARQELRVHAAEILLQVEDFRALHEGHDVTAHKPFALGTVPEIECYTCNEKFSFRPDDGRKGA